MIEEKSKYPVSQVVELFFSTELIKKPILWTLAQEYDVMTYIIEAKIKDGTGKLKVKVSAPDNDTLKSVTDWLKVSGVEVLSIEPFDVHQSG